MVAVGSSDSASAENKRQETLTAPRHRYFIVLVLTLSSVVFLIAAPAADWSRALAIAIGGVALTVTVATSRERELVRRRTAALLGAAMTAVVLLIAFGLLPRWLVAVVAALITAGVPVALVRGLLRLLREEGVTFQSVAGSLAIYLSLGLIFSWLIGFVAQVSQTPYFAQHTSGTTRSTSASPF